NQGTIDFLSDGTFSQASSNAVITNYGTIAKTGGTGTTSIGVNISAFGGEVIADSGILALSSGESTSDVLGDRPQFVALPGATLSIGSFDFDQSDFTSSGILQFGSGSSIINSGCTVSVGTLLVQFGELTIFGNLTLTNVTIAGGTLDVEGNIQVRSF